MSDAVHHAALAQQARAALDYYEAAQQQRRAVTLSRDGDPLALGHALRHLAEILVESGAPHEAEAPVAEMLVLYQTRPVDPLEYANAVRCAAIQAAASSDDDTAHAFWAEARERYEALGVTAGVAEADAQMATLRL